MCVLNNIVNPVFNIFLKEIVKKNYSHVNLFTCTEPNITHRNKSRPRQVFIIHVIKKRIAYFKNILRMQFNSLELISNTPRNAESTFILAS